MHRMNTPAPRLLRAAALTASLLTFGLPQWGEAQNEAPEVGPTHAPLPAPAPPASSPAAPAAPGEPGKPAFGMPDPSAPLRYDTEYPPMHYEGLAQNNRIARLQARLDRGELKLDFEPGHGYLRSLLKALDIDP